MPPTTTRRLLLSSLVLAALVNVGCATPAVQCGMAMVESTQERLPASGRVTVDWIYEQGLPPARYGEAYVLQGALVIRMRGEPPQFNDICGLARLGHEVTHYYRSHR